MITAFVFNVLSSCLPVLKAFNAKSIYQCYKMSLLTEITNNLRCDIYSCVSQEYIFITYSKYDVWWCHVICSYKTPYYPHMKSVDKNGGRINVQCDWPPQVTTQLNVPVESIKISLNIFAF